MKVMVELIAKLSRIDRDQAGRVWLSAGQTDSVESSIPVEFRTGRPARAFALAYVIQHKPVHAVFGSLGGLMALLYVASRVALLIPIHG